MLSVAHFPRLDSYVQTDDLKGEVQTQVPGKRCVAETQSKCTYAFLRIKGHGDGNQFWNLIKG
jgi:hypothetical protein